MTRIALAILFALVAAAGCALIVPGARADERQDFIHRFHRDCCPHDRCFPVKAAPSIHFWDVEGFRSVVPLGKERYWHFKETYGCAYPHDAGTVRCLFMPAPEAS